MIYASMPEHVKRPNPWIIIIIIIIIYALHYVKKVSPLPYITTSSNTSLTLDYLEFKSR
jgi:hypothetical protein